MRGRVKSGGGNVKILLPETEAQGLAGSGEQREEPPSARKGEIRRRECEDFAPRNGGTRPSGERGAKRGGRRSRIKTPSLLGVQERGYISHWRPAFAILLI